MMMLKLSLLCMVGLAMVAGGAKAAGNPVVAVETSMGTFKVELYEDKAPATVKNFLTYVDEKFYDDTIFHRVIGKENKGDDFMIQGGGFTADMKQKPTKDPVKNEAANGVKNDKYTVAMARTGVVDSATAQFFVNVKDNDFLNHRDTSTSGFGYCAFGKVIEGTDVVDKIKAVETTTKAGMGDVPVKPVVIKSIRRVEKK
jgi:cyclophilin family peptidyl-prolyl cis-trans isomerase